ncbi:hypothetical protein PV797_09215 [Clostridiaceae bacterium M8S5]|nr:hypothetical protein PV797_09215 [Clostridiaceae bacterium M8S5]
MIKTIYKVDEVIDFIWELSKNDLHASYPRKNSMEDVKEDITRAINEDSRNIIACYHDNVLCGVCIYYWIDDDKYAQTSGFLISENFDEIAEELIGYIKEQLAGYELYIGLPTSNINANQYLEKKHFRCIDSCTVTFLYNLESPKNQNHDCIEKIIESNFEAYAKFHDKHAIPLEMWYNSERLLKDLTRFRVFAFKQDGEICASIFVRKNKYCVEVFGLFIDKEYEQKGIESALINEMLIELYNEFGKIEDIAYFIDENSTDELNAALQAGFEITDKFKMYKCRL